MKSSPSIYSLQRKCLVTRKSSPFLFQQINLHLIAIALVAYLSCINALSIEPHFLNNEIQNPEPSTFEDNLNTNAEEDHEPLIDGSQSNVRNRGL